MQNTVFEIGGGKNHAKDYITALDSILLYEYYYSDL